MAVTEHFLNIEIGPNITKVVETDEKLRSFKTFSAFSFPTPEGTIENGELQRNPEAFRRALDKELRLRRIKTRKAVLVLQEAKFGSREEQLPEMKDNKLKDYIQTNGRMFFPIQGENYQIVHRKNGPGVDSKQRVQLFAVPETLILTCESLCSFCGLSLVDIEIAENGIATLLQIQEPKRSAIAMIVEESNMIITIISGGHIVMQRNVPYGVADAVETVQESGYVGEGLSFFETLERMKKRNCFLSSTDDDGKGELSEDELPEDRATKRDATKELMYVFGNLTRMIEYYSSQHPNEEIEVFYLGGLANEIAGFKELFETEIGHESVSIMQTYLGTGKDPKNLANLSDRYDAVLAASRRPVGMTLSSAKKKKLGGTPASEKVKSAKALFALCFVAALGLSAYPIIMKMQYQQQIDSLNARINSLAEAKEINTQYNSVLADYSAIKSLDGYAEAGQKIPLLLSEIEKNMPSEEYIESMTLATEGITINFGADRRPPVEKTLQVFREFKSVQDPYVTGVTVTEAENGQKHFAYTLFCTFQTGDADETADTEETTENTEGN